MKAVVIAMSASTDSGINTHRFKGCQYAPTADWTLLKNAYDHAEKMKTPALVGSIASSDVFYDDLDTWKLWAAYGALAVEMEAAELYTLAAKYGRKALAILTISDNMITHEATTAEERQITFKNMMEIALEAIIK